MAYNVLKKNVKSVLIIATIVLALLSTSSRVQAAGGVNLALGSTATASFTFGGENPANTVDGSIDKNIRWTTYTSENTTEWLALDFGSDKTFTFNEVHLYIYKDTSFVQLPKSYTIQYWNGSSFVDVNVQGQNPGDVDASTADLNIVKFDQVTSQKLQVSFVPGTANIGVYELEVYMNAPTVILTSGETNPTKNSPFTVTVSFDEVMQNFDMSDVSVGNGYPSNLQTSDGQTYTVEITPVADGQVTVDVAGNGYTAAETFIIEYDATGPVIEGIMNDGIYSLGVNPIFSEGTATLSRNGDLEVTYTSGTAISEEGSYVLIVTDQVGNSTTIHFTVDKTGPEVATFTASTTEATHGIVRVTISYPEGAELIEYKVGSNGWQSYTAPVEVTSNDTVYARSTDGAGNVSEESSYEVNNIEELGSNGQFGISDVVQLINQDTLLLKDMNSDGVFDHTDVNIMLQAITPVSTSKE